MRVWTGKLLAGIVGALLLAAVSAGEPPAPQKPRIAFFPLAGNVGEDLRAKVGFSLRAKLDRSGTYAVIDGPRMADLAAQATQAIDFGTGPDAVRELGQLDSADVLVWGEMNHAGDGALIRLKILDLRKPDAQVLSVEKSYRQPTDLRFISEQVLEMLPGVPAFAHPSEEAVLRDPPAEALWAANPSLIPNSDFAAGQHWQAMYRSELYEPPVSDDLPPVDKIVVYRMPDDEGGVNSVLAMNLSQDAATTNGLACISSSISIQPDTRYRLSFRYRSDGPKLHVFVKGYTLAENVKGQKVEREIYRRQVPPTAGTAGQWVTVVDDLNPQHVAFPVQYLRVDLYAYLNPGIVMFDDVVLKAVGAQTRRAEDSALERPVSRPAAQP